MNWETIEAIMLRAYRGKEISEYEQEVLEEALENYPEKYVEVHAEMTAKYWEPLRRRLEDGK